jgi:flagellar basal-body rod protein FlgC
VDIFRAFGISASGLTAYRTRMDVISENLANAESTVTGTGAPYRRKLVLLHPTDGSGFQTLLSGPGARAGGVEVGGIVESQEAPRRVYQPEHPQAGPDGFRSLPNVNPVKEMVDMLMSTRAYEANVVAFQAAKSMGAKLLELLR